MTREKKLQDEIGYNFKDEGLLRQALFHSSYTNERGMDKKNNNERLEFLGDAVLQLIVTAYLFDNQESAPEGQLTKIRSELVRESSLKECALSINLGSYLYLGKGEEASGGRFRGSILADAFEALLGAVYLDGGYRASQTIVEVFLQSTIKNFVGKGINRDYKSKLQEELQQKGEINLDYRTVKEEGPDHDKLFYVEIYYVDKIIGKGEGRSKKEAEQRAAQDALNRRGINVF